MFIVDCLQVYCKLLTGYLQVICSDCMPFPINFRSLDGQTDGRTDRRTDRQTDRQTEGRRDERRDRRTDGGTDGGTNGGTDGRKIFPFYRILAPIGPLLPPMKINKKIEQGKRTAAH